jgi:hypothetical protein
MARKRSKKKDTRDDKGNKDDAVPVLVQRRRRATVRPMS